MKKQISFGAEATVYLDDKKIIKDRIRKDYRISEIDEKLRKSRTRREAKVLDKLAKINFPAPKLIKMDDQKMIVEMEQIKGTKLRDCLEKKNYKKLSYQIGKKLALLHNQGIIHGDLTTSNMILSDEVYFIDFGLSYFSERVEDKAVDLHLLRQALESKHHKVWEVCFKEALNAYKKQADNEKEIITRLDVVESRGKNKSKK